MQLPGGCHPYGLGLMVLKVFWCHRGPVGNPSRGSVRELSRLIGLTQLDFGESYFGLLFTPICGDLAFIVSSQENVMQHHTG